uniref:Lipocalin n=1 Tax=Rhipicephalus appendiculatus TaxID=34631 RepID=A0A131YH99_RHIAP
MSDDCNKIVSIIAMLTFASVQVLLTEDLPKEETRIEQYVNYAAHQDIYKAFNIESRYWLLGFNFESPHTANKSCVYFKTHSLTTTAMNYSSHFIKYGNCKGSIEYIGEFYKGPLTSDTGNMERETANSLRARTASGAWIVMNYTLIYSDYESCAVFRVPNMTDGSGCMVLGTDPVNGMTLRCETMFNSSCGKYHRFERVPGTECEKKHSETKKICDPYLPK